MLSASMGEASNFIDSQRYAVVTGANKGIGLEICVQLASKGVMVVLTARDEGKGQEAIGKLKALGLSGLVVFHQLDVVNPSSIYSLALFVKVNNAAISGVIVDRNALKASANGVEASEMIKLTTQSYDLAEECLETNYYGAKRMIEAFIPLLHLSNSPRIVNVSSSSGRLKFVSNEWAIGVLNDAENLTEERMDEILNRFRKDFKEGYLEQNGWPDHLSAYIISKAALNAYTRITANKYTNFLVNSVCPGYVKTDMNYKCGTLTVEEGAESAVRLALLPQGGLSGLFFHRMDVSPF